MIFRIVSSNKCPKRYIRKKTNEFLNTKNKDWTNRDSIFEKGVLFQIYNGGVLIDSLDETDVMYAMICKYIDFLFSNKEISVYGIYNEEKLTQIKGRKVSEI